MTIMYIYIFFICYNAIIVIIFLGLHSTFEFTCYLKNNVFMMIIYILNVVLEENNVRKCVKRILYYYNFAY